MLRVLVCIAGLILAAGLQAADSTPGKSSAGKPQFFGGDGWFDAGDFLDTAYGFVPVIYPITEPAVGYGAVVALVFIDRDVPGRPDLTVVGGLATENGTRGAFGMHFGTWMDGKLRTQVGVADMDVNLDFFGLGGNRAQGQSLGYTVSARGFVAGAGHRLGETSLWLGLRYALADTKVTLDRSNPGLPGIAASDLDQRLAVLTPSLTLDMRDNFFTPTDGWYVDLSVPLYREAFGGDSDFETVNLTAIHYRPLSRSLFLSARGTAKGSSDGTPFYLRPYVSLRGVPALRYQGEKVAEVEAELRWQLHSRFSLVGFGGAGTARSDVTPQDGEKTVTAGGAGFRYLIARKHGLHMGMDVAFGPDDPVIYVVFGSAWVRP